MSEGNGAFQPVEAQVSFPNLEEQVLSFWKAESVFERSVDQRPESSRYVFYDGPPFATGLPHYGHILAGTIKDVVTRYACSRGFHVERRFGWDCHGVPVEHEIDKALGVTCREDVTEKITIAKV